MASYGFCHRYFRKCHAIDRLAPVAAVCNDLFVLPLGILTPLIIAEHLAVEPAGEKSFEVPVKDEVVFAVEVDPALVAVVVVILERIYRLLLGDDLIKGIVVDVAQVQIQVHANRDIAVGQNHNAVEDAFARKNQVAGFPLIVQDQVIVVFFEFFQDLWNFTQGF